MPCRSLSKAIGSADTVICTIGAGGSDLSGPKRIDNEVGQSKTVVSAMLLCKPWRAGSDLFSLAFLDSKDSPAAQVFAASVDMSAYSNGCDPSGCKQRCEGLYPICMQWLDGSNTAHLRPCEGHPSAALQGVLAPLQDVTCVQDPASLGTVENGWCRGHICPAG